MWRKEGESEWLRMTDSLPSPGWHSKVVDALDNVGPPQIQGVSQHVARITTVMPTRRVFNKICNRFTHTISVQGAKPDFSATNVSRALAQMEMIKCVHLIYGLLQQQS